MNSYQINFQDISFKQHIMSSWIIYKWDFIDFSKVLQKISKKRGACGLIKLPEELDYEIYYRKKVINETIKKNTSFFSPNIGNFSNSFSNSFSNTNMIEVMDIDKEPLTGRRTAGVLFVDNSVFPEKILLCRELHQFFKDPNKKFEYGNVQVTPTMWSLPKGMVNEGESVLESAIKESIEEVGIYIKPKILRQEHVLYKFVEKNKLYYYYIYNISSEIFSEDKLYPLHIGSEIHDVKWFSVNEFCVNEFCEINDSLNKYSKTIIFWYLNKIFNFLE